MTNTLDGFAPYPEREEDVTADALARYLTVEGWARASRSGELRVSMTAAEGTGRHDAAVAAYGMNVAAFTAEHGLVSALRALNALNAGLADEVAKAIWLNWEDGGAVREWLTDWLSEYGIDPQQVAEAAVDQEPKAA